MQQQLQHPLKIFSASAGSGKTFRLVQEYLLLILGEQSFVSKKQFSKVLAMTFTNKAAWEMKARVIAALDVLSRQTNETLLNETIKTTQLSPEKIQERATIALSEILHNYEDFNLLTIDKFNLRLIRTFSRDLDIEEDVEVILDESFLLEHVIDELLSKIGRKGEEAITRLALAYAKENANEGSKWNFRDNLISFSKILTKENNQNEIAWLLKEEYTTEKFQEIKNAIAKIEQEHKEICSKLYAYFSSLENPPSDYPNGKKKGAFYDKMTQLSTRELKNYKAPTPSILSTLDGSDIKEKHNVDSTLLLQANALYEWEASHYSNYYTLRKARSNFYNNALLKYIANELEVFKKSHNLIGIYEFGKQIASLLRDESTPYIYERLGNRYHHYLLDEFQDTSRLQWLNLLPLLHESMGNNHANLIVGDPKQAIYRFRNGLVEQFVALPSIYNPENDPSLQRLSSYFEAMGKKVSMEHNFRSNKKIVEFNNLFFQQILTNLPPHFKKYYEDVTQLPIQKEGGYVHISKYDETDSDVILEKEKAFTLECISECINDGYFPGDICILVRNKNIGKELAKFLTDHAFKIISSDSLLVSSDTTVALCIDYLNLRKNNENPSLQMKFVASFFRLKNEHPITALKAFRKEGKGNRIDFSAFASHYFDGMEHLFFPYENLYDLGKQLLKLLGLSELNNLYLHHLMELFQVYDLKNGPDIRGFTEDWDANLAKNATIQMPENKEAIQIMTIHKAKGLEFPVVIIPRLTWRLGKSTHPHFVVADDATLLYTTLSKNNVPDYMTKAYEKEYEQQLLDELNLLYVAFTRPKNRLYSLLNTHLPKSFANFTQYNQVITIALNNWQIDGGVNNKEFFQFGERNVVQAQTNNEDAFLSFRPQNFEEFLWFPQLTLQDDKAMEEEQLSKEQQIGNQLHAIFAKIDGKKNVKAEIKKMEQAGKVDKEQVAELLSVALSVEKKLFEQPYFQGDFRVLNEQDIITGKSSVKRPDKIVITDKTAVVIDFKTGKEERKYHQQVREYCALLRTMLQKEVKGYLFYTTTMEIEEVVLQ